MENIEVYFKGKVVSEPSYPYDSFAIVSIEEGLGIREKLKAVRAALETGDVDGIPYSHVKDICYK